MAIEKTTVIGSSPESFTAATDDALDHAEAAHDDVLWAEVELRGVEVASVPDREYQVEVVVAYRA